MTKQKLRRWDEMVAVLGEIQSYWQEAPNAPLYGGAQIQDNDQNIAEAIRVILLNVKEGR